MSRPTRLNICVDAFSHNLQIAKEYAQGAQVMPVMKANAYGHGIKHFCSLFPKIEAIGVSCIEEALELRQLGFKQRIMLMEGVYEANELQAAEECSLDVVLHHESQLALLKSVKFKKPLSVWLKINTGMNRLGFPATQLNQLMQALNDITAIRKPFGLMTHFAQADKVEDSKTQEQCALFTKLTTNFSGLKTAANSAALLAHPQSLFDLVRPGIMLYGISPFSNQLASDFNLKPVMTFSSALIAINACKKGQAVGYGSTWLAKKDSLIGIVAAGYGDGYPRHAKSGTKVLVNGKAVPIVGTVSMDMLAIDVTEIPQVKIGDEVILWGEGLPVELVAQQSDTIAYELVCNIKPNSVRLYLR